MTARRLVGSDGIALVLREGHDCHYVEEDAVSPLWKGARFPMSACISGWAMSNARTAVVADILKDPRIPQELYRRTFVRSLVMAPIGGRAPVGALGAYWAQAYSPSRDEVETVEALADAAAAAIRRLEPPGEAAISRFSRIGGPPTVNRRCGAGVRRRLLRLIPRRELSFWPGQLLAVSGVAGSALLLAQLSPLPGEMRPFTPFFPAILAAALWAGPRAAATAVLGSVAAAAGLDLASNPDVAYLHRAPAWAFFAVVAAAVAALAAATRVVLDEQRRHLAALEARDQELAAISRELDHRIRNLLTVMTGLTIQTARSSATPAEMSETLVARLEALAQAQALVVRHGARGLSLQELARDTLAAFMREGEIQIDIDEQLEVPPGAQVSLALALHELATNAVKHGALARGGRVTLSATSIGDRRRLAWRESGAGGVRPAGRRGAGSRLIERAVGAAPGGAVELRFEPDGLSCDISWRTGTPVQA